MSHKNILLVLDIINFFVLQWLFLHIALMINEDEETTEIVILGGIVPLTGWISRPIFIQEIIKSIWS